MLMDWERTVARAVPREAQGRIFNAFEQADSDTSSNYGGTGLGLTISSRLVQLMGGSLEVDSRGGSRQTNQLVCRFFVHSDEFTKIAEKSGIFCDLKRYIY